MEQGQAIPCCLPYTKENKNKLAEEKFQISFTVKCRISAEDEAQKSAVLRGNGTEEEEYKQSGEKTNLKFSKRMEKHLNGRLGMRVLDSEGG